ncbi:hypothetical protein B1P92_05440 [Enterococcus faecium]|nr:hypothetical protein B1P92_05440 [Enterococcus faecium]
MDAQRTVGLVHRIGWLRTVGMVHRMDGSGRYGRAGTWDRMAQDGVLIDKEPKNLVTVPYSE